jgi:hypothetical protein
MLNSQKKTYRLKGGSPGGVFIQDYSGKEDEHGNITDYIKKNQLMGREQRTIEFE